MAAPAAGGGEDLRCDVLYVLYSEHDYTMTDFMLLERAKNEKH